MKKHEEKKVEVKVEVEEIVLFGQEFKICVDHAIMYPCSLTQLTHLTHPPPMPNVQ